VADAELHIVELAERSDTGRVRDHNEDRAFAAAHLVAVADGMGGALAGEVASQMAVEAIEAVRPPADPQTIRMALENANRAIRRMAAQDPSKAGMGTTMTAATLDGDGVSIVHVGDSRAYLWRGGELQRLTDDHSVVAELVRRGSLSPEEAENHPHRNVITRALGAEPDVKVDTYAHALEDGDVLLLCSDGLYTEVPDPDVAQVLAGTPDLATAADALVDLANANGGSDNVTVVLARVGRGPAVQVDPTQIASDTQEYPPITTPDGTRPTEERPNRTTKVIGGTGPPPRAGSEAAAPPRVLQRGGRRRGPAPVLVGVVVALALVVGAAAWAVSRSYSLATGPGDTVWVMRGVDVGPLDLRARWQDTGVPAAEAGSLGGISGVNETVARAARIVWTAGLPDLVVPEPVVPNRSVPGVGPVVRPGAG